MPHTLPPLPTRVQLLAARKVAANPADFVDEPDFPSLIAGAWWVLKVDQMERREAQRAAEAIRSTFPEDAA